MNYKVFHIYFTTVFLIILGTFFSQAEEHIVIEKSDKKGYIEIECNISNVKLSLCPKDNFIKTKRGSFLGLFSYYEYSCSEGQLHLGLTPLKLTPTPVGKYVLLFPKRYVGERRGPVEITISPDKKVHFLLKLFIKEEKIEGNDSGEGAAGGGGDVGEGAGGGDGSPY